MSANPPPRRNPAALSSEEQKDLRAFIDVLNEKLVPHLVTLTPEQRRTLKPLDGEQIAFMHAMHRHMKANPDLVPDTVDMAQYERDLANFNFLHELTHQLRELQDALNERMLYLDPVSRVEAADALRAAMSGGESARPGKGADDAGAAHPDGEA